MSNGAIAKALSDAMNDGESNPATLAVSPELANASVGTNPSEFMSQLTAITANPSTPANTQEQKPPNKSTEGPNPYTPQGINHE